MFDTLLRALALAGIVSVVAALSVWTVRTAYGQLFGPARRVVMPFQVVGKPDADLRLGTALAQMLIGRLARIQDETESTITALREIGAPVPADAEGPTAQTTQVTERPSLALPSALFEPVDLELSLAGVDVGGVVSWVQRWFQTDDAMRVTVEFVEGEQRTIVAGGAPGGMKPIHLDVPSQKHQEVIDLYAYRLIQQQLGGSVPQVRVLELGDFRDLLTALARAAEAKARGPLLGAAGRDAFESSYRVLAPIADKARGWCDLQAIVAQLARAGADEEEALLRHENALRCSGTATATRERLQAEADELRREVQARRLAEAAPATEAPPYRAPEQPPDPVLERLLQSQATRAVLDLVGVADFAMPRAVRVGIVGGLPSPALLPAGSWRVVGDGAGAGAGAVADRGDPYLRGYVDSLAQWVRAIAPRAQLVFAPFDGGTAVQDSTLLRAVDLLLQEPPQVLLLAFGPLRGTVWATVLGRAAERGVLVVLPAGNQPDATFAFQGTPLMSRVLVAASTDLAGRPSAYTTRVAGGCWAPGEALPIVETPGAPLAVRSGTSYAAAVCAGVAARVLAEQPALGVEALVARIRASAAPAPGAGSGGAAPVVNLAKALQGR